MTMFNGIADCLQRLFFWEKRSTYSRLNLCQTGDLINCAPIVKLNTLYLVGYYIFIENTL